MGWPNMLSMSVGCLLNLFLRVLLLTNDVFILRIEILRIHAIVLMVILNTIIPSIFIVYTKLIVNF